MNALSVLVIFATSLYLQTAGVSVDIPKSIRKVSPVRYNVKPPYGEFTDREQEIQKLNDEAELNNFAVLAGPPKSGKTQLVRRYLEKYADEYKEANIIWLNGNNKNSFLEDLRNIAAHLSLPQQDSILGTFRKIITVLKTRKTLIVIDNAHPNLFFKSLHKYVSQYSPIKVIIITQDKGNFGKRYHVIQVKPLPVKDESAKTSELNFKTVDYHPHKPMIREDYEKLKEEELNKQKSTKENEMNYLLSLLKEAKFGNFESPYKTHGSFNSKNKNALKKQNNLDTWLRLTDELKHLNEDVKVNINVYIKNKGAFANNHHHSTIWGENPDDDDSYTYSDDIDPARQVNWFNSKEQESLEEDQELFEDMDSHYSKLLSSEETEDDQDKEYSTVDKQPGSIQYTPNTIQTYNNKQNQYSDLIFENILNSNREPKYQNTDENKSLIGYSNIQQTTSKVPESHFRRIDLSTDNGPQSQQRDKLVYSTTYNNGLIPNLPEFSTAPEMKRKKTLDDQHGVQFKVSNSGPEIQQHDTLTKAHTFTNIRIMPNLNFGDEELRGENTGESVMQLRKTLPEEHDVDLKFNQHKFEHWHNVQVQPNGFMSNERNQFEEESQKELTQYNQTTGNKMQPEREGKNIDKEEPSDQWDSRHQEWKLERLPSTTFSSQSGVNEFVRSQPTSQPKRSKMYHVLNVKNRRNPFVKRVLVLERPHKTLNSTLVY